MAPRKKATQKRRSKWTPETILTDPKSPLASCDLRSVLSNPVAWTSLTIEDRREILSLLPDMAHTLDTGTDDARPNFETLMNDDSFRYDCATYIDNLARGRHDPVWLEDAWRAHEKRAAGEFEEWLRHKFVEDWGVDIPDEMSVKISQNEETEHKGLAEAGHGEDKGVDCSEELDGREKSPSSMPKEVQYVDEGVNRDSNHSMTED